MYVCCVQSRFYTVDCRVHYKHKNINEINNTKKSKHFCRCKQFTMNCISPAHAFVECKTAS